MSIHRRLGIFGGTFDPVHIGHLRCVIEVKELLGLDRVILVPCRIPPHRSKPFADSADRYAMLQLAVQGVEGLEVSDFELKQPGKSYTIYTLQHFRSDADELFFIIGSDAFGEIKTWHRWNEIFGLASFAVMIRAGSEPRDVGSMIPSEVRGEFTNDGLAYRHRSGNLVVPVEVSKLDISSTQIRRLVSDGRSIRFLVTEAVGKYIEENNLYRLG